VSMSCSGCVGLWCPSMRGGVVVGSQGEGGRSRSIPDRGGVRVCRRIGERVFVVGGSGRLMCVCLCMCVYTFIVCVSFKVCSFIESVSSRVGVSECWRFMCVSVCGLWWPSMRGGDFVGAQGDGGRRSSIPDIGGVRWSVFGVLLIGEREILVGECGRTGVVVGWCGAVDQWSYGEFFGVGVVRGVVGDGGFI